jgi:hypothetical protein
MNMSPASCGNPGVAAGRMSSSQQLSCWPDLAPPRRAYSSGHRTGAPAPLPASQWPATIAYEWGAMVKALVFQRSC